MRIKGPDDPRRRRLQELQDEFTRNPGAAPGGTGLTGLNKDDGQGYSALLNRQTEYLNLQRELDGQGPLRVQRGGIIPSQLPQGPSPFDTLQKTMNQALGGMRKGFLRG